MVRAKQTSDKQQEAIRILEHWLYQLYIQPEADHVIRHSYIEVKSMIGKKWLMPNQFNFLRVLWDEYVLYKKENDAR